VNLQNAQRSEDEIFTELEALASEPGYAHALAALCFRDNTIGFADAIEADDIAKMYSKERLIRTEISTLIGLLVKTFIDLTLPAPDQFQDMLDRSDALLLELHKCMAAPFFEFPVAVTQQQEPQNPFTQGSVMREAIFYGGESAYAFQYRDFAAPKYAADNSWIKSNKGFVIEEAETVVRCISKIQNDKLLHTQLSLKTKHPNDWTMLPGYIFDVEEVTEATGLDQPIVINVLNAFVLPAESRNESFKMVSDFNIATAFPLIRIDDRKFLLYQNYSLVEALYESPFYWMTGEPSYADQAAKNRGVFTEQFCANRMRLVFGERRVYKNVVLMRWKKVTVGEIDTLVVFGNRAIIIQAKSKRLTIESRKGNDNQIKEDFKRAIQSSYEQGLSCAKALSEDDIRVLDKKSRPIEIPETLKEIYILCVISEHYPALAFQSRQLISAERTGQIMPPLVLDIFALDAMAEMLQSPLHFLSYLNRRTEYDDRVLAAHELTVLSYHLKHNLWIDPKFDLFHLDDDVTADLDAAMLARREGLPGKKTPDGILSRLKETAVGRVVGQIEHTDDPASVDLGFMLLTLGENTVLDLSKGIEEIARRTRVDSLHHDITIGVGGGDTGITVHCNEEPDNAAMERLTRYCEKRKYKQKVKSWFGLCLDPKTIGIRFGLSLNYPWQQSDEMDEAVANLAEGQKKINLTTYVRPQGSKIGRNEPCPCGSGQKYKKCCLNR